MLLCARGVSGRLAVPVSLEGGLIFVDGAMGVLGRMCGITGWVDFTRDLREERDTAQAMTASMSLRGPDDEGLWLSPHAAIGHRRLAVIDLPGGKQPMVEHDTVLTYSGEVYNYRELRRELISAGHAFRTHSDTEVVLHAYLEWGVEMVHRLNGMYSFAIWDGRTEELLLVRDRLGIKPLYYYPLADGLLFGSEPKAILANPLAERMVNRTGFCAFLISSHDFEGQTIFRNLFDLQPGHYIRLSRDGMSKQRYWKLKAHPHEDDLPSTVAHVREMLEDIVARQMISDVPLCTLLSGGLDSSTLAAFAKRVVDQDKKGAALNSFSVDFDGHTENFRPDHFRPDPDQPFALDAARHIESMHRTITLETEQLWNPETRGSVLRAWDLPCHLGDMDVALYLLFGAISEHSTVALSGESADEIFGGYPWMHNQAALELPIFPWMAAEMLRGDPTQLYNLFSPELMEHLNLLEYIMGLYASALSDVPRLAGEEGADARMREATYFDLTRFMRHFLDRKDRMSMAVGLEVRVPFCDHRLVEYMFNVPWSMRTSDGREKSILRMVAGDLIPQSVLQRKKSAFPINHDEQYNQGLRKALQRILDDSATPLRPSLNEENARALLDAPLGEDAQSERLRIENAVRMNAWLEEYQVDLSTLG